MSETNKTISEESKVADTDENEDTVETIKTGRKENQSNWANVQESSSFGRARERPVKVRQKE